MYISYHYQHNASSPNTHQGTITSTHTCQGTIPQEAFQPRAIVGCTEEGQVGDSACAPRTYTHQRQDTRNIIQLDFNRQHNSFGSDSSVPASAADADATRPSIVHWKAHPGRDRRDLGSSIGIDQAFD